MITVQNLARRRRLSVTIAPDPEHALAVLVPRVVVVAHLDNGAETGDGAVALLSHAVRQMLRNGGAEPRPCFAPKGIAINATGYGASAAATLTTPVPSSDAPLHLAAFAAIYRLPDSATKLYHGAAVCNVKGRSDSAAAAVASDAGMRLLSAALLISISERDYLRAKGSAEQRLQRKSPPFKSCTVVLESRAINLLQVTRRAASARLMMPPDARLECGESCTPGKKADEVFRTLLAGAAMTNSMSDIRK